MAKILNNGTVELLIKDNIAIMIMKCGENRMNTAFIAKVNKALDEVERNENVHALITTGMGKFYSNGIDLDWLAQITPSEQQVFFTEQFNRLFVRLLTFPVLTIAAINGHAYAGGAMLALSHDFRVMRTKRGRMCLNEVHINMVFGEFLRTFLRTRIPAGQVAHKAMVLGTAFTAEEALSHGLIDVAADEQLIMNEAMSLIKKTFSQNGPYLRQSMRNMKEDMFQHVVEVNEKEIKRRKSKL